MKFSLLEILKDFIALLYPNNCLTCSANLVKGEDLVCSHCLLDMPKTDFHKDAKNELQVRLSLRFPVKYAFAYYYFKKGGKVQELLHQLKYKNHPELGQKIGKVVGSTLIEQSLSNNFDIIVPVPLHQSRKRIRGYNQSEEFAKGLSEVLGIPFTTNFIKRISNTSSQTRKSKLHRWLNVYEVFEMKYTEEINGKRVLLVDDVVTTGATLEACSAALYKAGCLDISVACIAVA